MCAVRAAQELMEGRDLQPLVLVSMLCLLPTLCAPRAVQELMEGRYLQSLLLWCL